MSKDEFSHLLPEGYEPHPMEEVFDFVAENADFSGERRQAMAVEAGILTQADADAAEAIFHEATRIGLDKAVDN